MKRDDLEAVIWQALKRHNATIRYPVPFIETILQAAEQYGRDKYGITAQRRADLLNAVALVHFDADGVVACQRSKSIESGAAAYDVNAVTCRRCRHTRAYTAALAEAS